MATHFRNIPPKNPSFCGRKALLSSLAALLQEGGMVTLSGPKGIGKSALCREYAHYFIEEEAPCYILRGDDPVLLSYDFAVLGLALSESGQDLYDLEICKQDTRKLLSVRSGWLLIIEDVEDPQVLKELVPFPSGGQILVVTRGEAPSGMATLRVPPLGGSEANELFAPALGSGAKSQGLPELVALCQGVPLPLALCLASLRHRGGTPAEFVPVVSGRERHIEPTEALVEQALLHLEDIHPLGPPLLNLCAHLRPDALSGLFFSPEFIRRGLSDRGEEDVLRLFLSQLADPDVLSRVILGARMVGLLDLESPSIQEDIVHLQMNRHIGELLRTKQAPTTQALYRDAALRMILGTFPDGAALLTPRIRAALPLLPHALYLTKPTEEQKGGAAFLSPKTEALSIEAVDRLARFFAHIGSPKAADVLLLRQRAHLSPMPNPPSEADLPALVRQINTRVDERIRDGDLAGARADARHALGLLAQMAEPPPFELAEAEGNLGSVLLLSGQSAEAIVHMRRAEALLAQGESPLGRRQLAMCLTNLGQALHQEGDLAKAQESLQRAVHLFDALSDTGRPMEVALSSLGEVHKSLGDLDKARRTLCRCLSLMETRLGPTDPLLGPLLAQLAALCLEMGQDKMARTYARRAAPLLDALVVS